MGGCPRWRAWRIAGTLLVALALVTGCASTPPPQLVPPSPVRTSVPGIPGITQIVVGLDNVTGGYNPHKIADESLVTTALSDLLLPSVFRTAPDGTPTLDRSLMVSAQVTKADPFTVTYAVRTDASWSDGTPVDAADFVYLRNQMTSQPGVIDAAGYRLISDISARDNGKVVQVVFAKPYPEWRSLFSGLLPAHLLKDAPGGWASALTGSFPASAGPFNIRSLDVGGGEIVLERNDRYWDKPSVLDQIVLRTAEGRDVVDALRSGADQVAYVRADAPTMALLGQLSPAVSLMTVPRAELAAVLLRPGTAQLADPVVRAAIAAVIDRNALIATGTGGGPSAQLPADAIVTLPSSPGYTPTLPPGAAPAAPDLAAASHLLTQAGYQNVAGLWSRDGHPLSLVIAAPAGREPYVSIAKQLTQQLTLAGIQANLITPAPAALYSERLPAVTEATASRALEPVDIVVGPMPGGTDLATELASRFGCAPTTPGSTNPLPASPLGLCDPSIQPIIDAALSGDMSITDALAAVEPALWAQHVVIPLFQVSDELAVMVGTAINVSAGAPLAGPFVGAAGWSRAAP